MFDEIREQTHAKSSSTATGLVPGLVLIETPVRIARCLADVQPPWLMSPGIMQQNDVHGMPSASLADRDRPQRAGRSYRFRHPLRLAHRSKTHILCARLRRLLGRKIANTCPSEASASLMSAFHPLQTLAAWSSFDPVRILRARTSRRCMRYPAQKRAAPPEGSGPENSYSKAEQVAVNEQVIVCGLEARDMHGSPGHLEYRQVAIAIVDHPCDVIVDIDRIRCPVAGSVDTKVD